MSVLAIITVNAEPDMAAVLEKHYPGKFRAWSDRTWLVATSDTPKALSDKVGVYRKDESGNAEGTFKGTFVVQLSKSYYGFGPSSFWDWLKQAHQEDL